MPVIEMTGYHRGDKATLGSCVRGVRWHGESGNKKRGKIVSDRFLR